MTPRRAVLVNVLAAVAYAVLGLVTLAMGQFEGLAAPVWPAAGLAVGLVCTFGWRVLPGIAVGSLVANSGTLLRADVDLATAGGTAAVIAVGAVLQALLAWYLVRRFAGWPNDLVAAREILLFLVLAGPVACLVSPTIGVTAQLLTGVLPAEHLLDGWMTWFVGDVVGVAVFAPLTLMLLPDPRGAWTGRRWKVALPSLALLIGFSIILLQSAQQEQAARQVAVQQLADEAARDLENSVGRHQEVLEGVRGLVLAEGSVSPEEFRQYTAPIFERYASLQALSLNPIVRGDQLDAFQQAMRAELADPAFTVTERNADGDLVPVEPRDRHVVVSLIEPLEANRPALGFDIASNPVRAAAIDTAIATGLPTATAPIDLVQEQGTQKGALALLPVYEGSSATGSPGAVPTEFVVGVYRFGDLLAGTLAGTLWDRVDVTVTDVTDAAEPVTIAERAAVVETTRNEAEPAPPTAVSESFDFYGRTWQVSATPTSGPLSEAALPTPASFLLIGVAAVIFLEAFVLLLTGMEQRARREAELSSYEAGHDALTGLLNRRAFLRQLDAARMRALDGEADSQLLFLDLDGFKQVNDVSGHATGDRMLADVAHLIRDQVRTRDVVARLGGDEFAMLLIDCPADVGLRIANNVVTAVGDFRFPAPEQEHAVGVSIGMVGLQSGTEASVDALMHEADQACYEAKRAGKGAVRVAPATV